MKAGYDRDQHNEMLKLQSSVRAGGEQEQHHETLQVRTSVKAGDAGIRILNHSESLAVRS